MPLLNGKHRDSDTLAQQQQQQPLKALTRRCNAGNTPTVGQRPQTLACEGDRVNGVKELMSPVAAANGTDDDATDVGRS